MMKALHLGSISYYSALNFDSKVTGPECDADWAIRERWTVDGHCWLPEVLDRDWEAAGPRLKTHLRRKGDGEMVKRLNLDMGEWEMVKRLNLDMGEWMVYREVGWADKFRTHLFA